MAPRLGQVLLIEPELSRDLLVPASRGGVARDSPPGNPEMRAWEETLQPRGNDLRYPVFPCAAPPAWEVRVFLFP